MKHKNKTELRSSLAILYRSHNLEHYVAQAKKLLGDYIQQEKPSHMLIYKPLSDEINILEGNTLCSSSLQCFFPKKELPPHFTDERGNVWRPQISAKALCVVPSRGVTLAGARLGRGGGWYDRFLQENSDFVTTISIVPDFAVFSELPTESHDQVISNILVASLKHE